MADYFHWLLLSLGSSLFPRHGAELQRGIGQELAPLPWLSMVSGQPQAVQPGAPWGARGVLRFPLLWVAADTLTQQR